MKIAINCIYFTEKGGGITEYIEQLVTRIVKLNTTNKFIFYITRNSNESFSRIVNGGGEIKIFPYESNQKLKRSLVQKYFWRNEEKLEKFDVFHSPFFYAPKFKNAKIILTVHDLRFLKYPKSYVLIRYLFLKLFVKKSIFRSDHIIAISNFTKNEIANYYDVSIDKISVIYEAVNPESFTINDFSEEQYIKNIEIKTNKYLLAVGHLEPRKNYIRLINSYLNLSSNYRDEFKLIIVGKLNHDFNKIVDKINHTDNVIYLDFVSREDLIWLYANCKLHVFPSFYEGFGFSSLEAGLFSKPTIGANQSSIPEISGKGGVYFDPFSVHDITEKISSVLENPLLYEKLSKQSKHNVARFSWDQNVMETLEVYEMVKLSI